MTKCKRGVTIRDIGKSISCMTCNELRKNGYCNYHKSYKIEKEKKYRNKPQYCKECEYFILYTVEKDYNDNVGNNWDGFCNNPNLKRINRDKLSKACMKGKYMPHLRTKVKEIEFRIWGDWL